MEDHMLFIPSLNVRVQNTIRKIRYNFDKVNYCPHCGSDSINIDYGVYDCKCCGKIFAVDYDEKPDEL